MSDTSLNPTGLRLDLVILDCPDALVLAQFYATMLGWGIEDGATRDMEHDVIVETAG